MKRNTWNRNRGKIGRAALATLLYSSSFVTLTALSDMRALAQTAATRTFSVPEASLERALALFGRQAGLQVTYNPAIATNKRSGGVRGNLELEDALGQLLAGTGLRHTFANATTISIVADEAGPRAGFAGDGSGGVLDTITVTGARRLSPADRPYHTAAPAAHISGETIERFRGSSPAEIFQGTAGVMSGEARNGAGAIDVNIRGMQGMGRVAVTVDGAANATTVYQGYQGISNRTFVDPDFIAGADIVKGSDAASSGIAGSVSMRTLEASDIVKEGRRTGIRIKGGFGTNTSSPPVRNTTAGYYFPTSPWASPTASSSTNGMDRPGFLTPTSGSGSIAAAVREDNFDFLAGYARRRQGNYHAGSHGPAAEPVNIGPRYGVPNAAGFPQDWPTYIENTGIANYRAGEEVLNTQLETESYLAKGTLRFENGHDIQIGYNGFRSEAGDLMASRLTDDRLQSVQRQYTTGAKVDTGTFRYRWNPDDNDLVNLEARLWASRLELRNPRRDSSTSAAVRALLATLPADFRTGTDTVMWGSDISNTSVLPTDYGTVNLTYGLSYMNEDTQPSLHTRVLEGTWGPRDGVRQEAAAYVKAAWDATDWMTLNAGLRYQHFWSKDRSAASSLSAAGQRFYIDGFSVSDGGFSPSAGVTLKPHDDVQLYVNYSNAMRMPSLMEATSTYGMAVNGNVSPERSSNWEIGTNLTHDGLFGASDQAMLKVGYFNWNVRDYISREYIPLVDMNTRFGLVIDNIARARFSGIELSGRYENNGFSAELAANYYTNVEFCRTDASCESKSLYGDYATNQVPPEYSVSLTLSQRMLDDRLTVGARTSHTGARAIGHGDVSGQGAAQFIVPTVWKPYTLVDAFAEYKINDTLTFTARVNNLFDRFYVDPLSLVQQPGPGRTFYASLTANF